MQKTLTLTRHATIDMYLYTESFRTRKPILRPDRILMTNMYLVPLLDFDVSELAGKEIKSATLTMTCLNKLETYAVDISTVSQQWNDQVCTNYNRDVNTPWTNDGWMADVVLSAGHSKYFREDVAHGTDGKTATVNVNPAIIEAMANGQSFGMLVMDVKSKFYGHPETMHEMAMQFSTDESLGAVPTLTVEYEDAPVLDAPKPLCALYAAPISVEDEVYAAIQLSWDACSCYSRRAQYELYISETVADDITKMRKLEKFQTPFIDGGKCGTSVYGLKPNTPYYFAAVVRDLDKVSAPVFASAKTLNLEIIPEFPIPAAPDFPCSAQAFTANGFTVGVTDDMPKVNPVTGELLAFGNAAPVWNNGIFRNGTVSLAMAKNEKTGFQLSVSIDADAADFDIAICGCAAEYIRVYRLWCLQIDGQWVPDAVVPVMDGKFQIPFAENKIPGQKQLTLWVDCLVPPMVDAGKHEACITLTSNGASVKIPVMVDVAPFALSTSDFKLELNGYVFLPECGGTMYGEPGALDLEREYYRMGTMHDSTINILPYSHMGTVQAGYAPEIGLVDGEMHVTDWTEWDKHFEQYLDGSYMVDVTGDRQPVTHIYLPFHENWPMSMEQCYKIKVPDLPYPDNVTYQVQHSTTIENDFLPEYRAGIKSVMKDFVKHFEEKGWKGIDFQYFFNNKNFYKEKRVEGEAFKYGVGLAAWLGYHTTPEDGSGSSWWLLDEPHFRADWDALRFYATILREVQAETGSGKQIKFRADLSCYFQAFDRLDGLLDINVGGGGYTGERVAVLRRRKRLYGEEYWPYGSWNAIAGDNADSVRWIVDVYLQGSRGIIPWYNFALDLNYEDPDDLSGIYPGQRFGLTECVASTRLKAGRKALELIRYFDAMKRCLGYSDNQLRAYVESFVQLKGEFIKKDSIDAGRASFSGNAGALEELKRDMRRKLTAATGMYF